MIIEHNYKLRQLYFIKIIIVKNCLDLRCEPQRMTVAF